MKNNKIGQGTHGEIFVDNENTDFIIKKYKLSSNYCDKLQNEYEIQKFLYNNFENIDTIINIPNACCFMIQTDYCSYKMNRIFPFPSLHP
jgi:hypothetical protein